ncbi:MAG: Nudix family hydrolase [Sterolibacterium sp.]|nr:Nudix family hydrolase [Sterolibacterium sp.]
MKTTEVAAAVILREDGAFLLGRRPPGSVYAGYWEFPGGKIEADETPRAALIRELQEELGIQVDTEQALPWLVREHAYAHAHVRLHFFRVRRWQNALRALQHDALHWQPPGAVDVAPLLPANAPILAALNLPDVYAITQASGPQGCGVEAQLLALAQALAHGLRLVQLREPWLTALERENFAQRAVTLCQAHGARLLIHGDAALARRCHAQGVHLSARQLMSLEQRPDFPLVAASCHNAEELARAAQLALDFVVLGAIKATASHPGQPGMGWPACARLLAACPLPVYALGGLSGDDLPAAWQSGAHGIAAIRAAWRPWQADQLN